MELVAADAARAVQRQDIVIVVDVLRATSTIVTALVSDAQAIMPLRSIEQAREMKRANPEYILAGERGGLRPSDFDLGNSPSEYTRGRVKGKRIILTTSSGTQTLEATRDAPVVLVGSFLNATAVSLKAKKLSKEMSRNVTIALSGRLGEFSLEDFICGGAIVCLLEEEGDRCSDSAYAARLCYSSAEKTLLQSVLLGNHARDLVDLGFSGDVEFCCTLDRYDIAPQLESGWIVRGGSTRC